MISLINFLLFFYVNNLETKIFVKTYLILVSKQANKTGPQIPHKKTQQQQTKNRT